MARVYLLGLLVFSLPHCRLDHISSGPSPISSPRTSSSPILHTHIGLLAGLHSSSWSISDVYLFEKQKDIQSGQSSLHRLTSQMTTALALSQDLSRGWQRPLDRATPTVRISRKLEVEVGHGMQASEGCLSLYVKCRSLLLVFELAVPEVHGPSN